MLIWKSRLNRCKSIFEEEQKDVKTNAKDLSVWDENDVKAFKAENEKPIDYSKEGGFVANDFIGNLSIYFFNCFGNETVIY